MRINESQIYSTVLSNLNSNLRDIDLLNYQVSSGQKIRYASDDPVATHQTMWYTSDISRTDQYLSNIGESKDWLMATDTVLDDIGALYNRSRNLVVQGANDTMVQPDRDAIASEIDQLIREMADVANQQHGSRYLLGGNETLDSSFNEAPFQLVTDAGGNITDVVYAGDNHGVFREVDEGIRMQINVVGDELFQADNYSVTAGDTSITDPTAPLSTFYGPNQGYFRIDGNDIYYDTMNDSLNDLAARINAAQVGVSASIDSTTTPGSFRLRLTTDEPHGLWLRDIDRASSTPQIEGLLDDMGIVDGTVSLDSAGNYTDNIHASALETGEDTTAFRIMIRIRDDLRAGNVSALSGADLGDLDAASAKLMTMRAEVGGKLNRLEQKDSRLRDYRIQSEELLSEADDTDMADAIMRLKQYETVQQAALQAGAKIFSLSLMNFLG